MKIRIGIRNNLFYPFMLLLFINLCRGVEIIIKYTIKDKDNIKYIYPILIFIPQLFGGIFAQLYNINKEKKENTKSTKIEGIELIKKTNELKRPDSKNKILLIVILASYFNFITILLGKHYFPFYKQKPTDSFLERRIRSMQIFITSILCYLTLRIKIYKHQLFSIIIIFVFLIIIFVFEIFWVETSLYLLLIYVLHFLIRGFLDTSEKYLFEFNFVNTYIMLIYEGFISIILYIILSIIYMNPLTIIKKIIDEEKETNFYIIIILIVLLILFIILSGFRHIYRVNTIKLYSPMTHALTELILDPAFVAYSLAEMDDKDDIISFFWPYVVIIVICLIIMSFLSLVYNDFIVLYCFGLEENTHLEIKNRAKFYSLTDIEVEEE